MKNLQRWALSGALYLGWPWSVLSAQGFSHWGISLDTTVSALAARFPHSFHVAPQQWASEYARYSVHIEARDATSLVYYIEATLKAAARALRWIW